MRPNYRVDQFWKATSSEILDRAVRSSFIRNWFLQKGIARLHQSFMVENRAKQPEKVQEMRYTALSNLLHTVNHALSDGRISPQVRRSIIETFIGNVLMGEEERMQPFREQHGFEPPSFITISPTQRCNLNCKGCYAVSSARNKATLPYTLVKRILKEKHDDWGSRFTVISGGEPLIYRSEGKDLFDVLHEFNDNYFMMYTNATLIDDDTARRMAEAGNITPAISVEGWEKETDERRGKGVFRKIQKAMENLRKHGVPFGISITATRYNAETILSDDFLDHYFEQQGAIYGWIFQYMPIGREYTTYLMVTPEQRQWMVEQEMDMIYDRNLFLVDFWNGGPMSLGCLAAGRSGGYFYIDWNGNVAPCVFFPYAIANVYELYEQNKNLTDVLKTQFFRTIRRWQDGYGYKQRGSNVKNFLRPCPIRDHYKFAYQTIQKFDTKPMDQEAALALDDSNYRRRMIDYDAELKQRLDPIWEEHFIAPEREKEETKKAVSA